MNGKSTSIDVAHFAGVSQSTVSRALRGDPSVRHETRRRIEEIARRLDYAVDKNASNLRTQHANTIALLFFADATSDDSHINPFFLAMLGSITRECSRRGYDLLVSFQESSGNWLLRYENSKKADGLILLGYGDYLAYQERLEALISRGTHFVRWGAACKNHTGVTVGSDNFRGGYLAAKHLLDCGRRRVAFLGCASDHYPECLDRYDGYAAALIERGIAASEHMQIDAISTEESGIDAVDELLSRGLKFDAVCAATDMIALGAMRGLREHGFTIPGDIAVVGFDDIPAARLAYPPLTTVAQDTARAGQVLVDTLQALITGDTPPNRVLPAGLVIRQSCGGIA